MKNDSDQTTNSTEYTKLCEKCNVQVRLICCDAHIKSRKHLTGQPDTSRKVCEICDIEINPTAWGMHIRSKNI